MLRSEWIVRHSEKGQAVAFTGAICHSWREIPISPTNATSGKVRNCRVGTDLEESPFPNRKMCSIGSRQHQIALLAISRKQPSLVVARN
jgi:hypothetical protein